MTKQTSHNYIKPKKSRFINENIPFDGLDLCEINLLIEYCVKNIDLYSLFHSYSCEIYTKTEWQ